MNIPPVGAVWLCVLINSFFPIFGFLAAGRISPALFAFAGSAVGFACFAPWALKNRVFPLYFRRDLWPRLFAVGFLGSALPIVALVTALQYTTPANAAILGQVEAVYTVILSRLFLKERITASQLFGTALVLSGTLLIAYNERLTVRWTGDLIVLAVPLMYQVSHLFSKRLPKDLSPAFVASARTLFASLGLLPLLLAGLWLPVVSFTPGLGLLGLVLGWGIVLTALNNLFWYRAILNMDLSKATAIVLSYPVLTAVLSHLLGIERVHGYQVIGLCLALSGAWWVTLLARREADPAAAAARA